MADAPNATEIPGETPVVVLTVPNELLAKEGEVKIVDEAKAKDQFINTIRRHLAHNQSVLIKHWYPDRRYGFSVDDIGMIRSFMDQDVHWQGNCILLRLY